MSEPTRYLDSRPNPNWRKPDYAKDRDLIMAARLKRQRKLAKMTATPEAIKRRVEMDREFKMGEPMPVPPPVHLD